MRTLIGFSALVLVLGLAAPANAQDASNYWQTNVPPPPKLKPRPQPTVLDKVKKFTVKAFDYNTYLPSPGSTDNTLKDPRLLPNATPSEVADDIIQIARPQDPVNIRLRVRVGPGTETVGKNRDFFHLKELSNSDKLSN